MVHCGVICSLPASPIITVPAVISAIGPISVIIIISVPAASVVILVSSLVYRAGIIITAIVGAPFSDSLPSIIILVIIAISVVTAVRWSPLIAVTPSPAVLSSRVASLIRYYWRHGVGDRCYRWRWVTTCGRLVTCAASDPFFIVSSVICRFLRACLRVVQFPYR